MTKLYRLGAFLVLAPGVAMTQQAQNSTPSQKAIGSGLTLATLEGLTLKFERLPEFGVLAPGQTDHARGKGLILLSIAAAAGVQRNWVEAHGLLGTSMLECSELDGLAYRSLFGFDRSGKGLGGGKMSETLELANVQFVSSSNTPITRESIVFRRESVIYAASWNLRGRFVYNRAGNWGRLYKPEPGHFTNDRLVEVLRAGVSVYDDLNKQGYRDETLRAVLGTAFAVLTYDRAAIPRDIRIASLVGTGQVFQDALQAALASLRKLPPAHSQEVLDEIEKQLRWREQKVDDQMLSPETPDQLQTLLRILDTDLDGVQRAAKSEKTK